MTTPESPRGVASDASMSDASTSNASTSNAAAVGAVAGFVAGAIGGGVIPTAFLFPALTGSVLGDIPTVWVAYLVYCTLLGVGYALFVERYGLIHDRDPVIGAVVGGLALLAIWALLVAGFLAIASAQSARPLPIPFLNWTVAIGHGVIGVCLGALYPLLADASSMRSTVSGEQ